ncbi:NusG domain II-containing protein [Listeria sp. FSL L7-1509]|uniref:NusG domain II-containing protein n=1 Tax=Listeria immobilis TaxID=2713502 RepID=A0ABR6STB5_9LIST|nr:NusG domain II-containing protein [Listeria immobilis]MBC1482720.1 NusG domain II-containing protein [Listeria immobilis]MBC1506066.1 NusG domain II-containing protein [Listeria immobilis]MBC1508710.1 NusG domain II-containing protein [Listeria immobilis]MBC6303072.1 NusG domain II-containing protein [Listeria immobilis]MBC6311423.1 NusG domain II-containing protein [Listeria immobilis]
MRQYMKMVRPFDVIIITILILGSFLPLILFTAAEAKTASDEVIAIVSQDGKVIRKITLTGHKGNEQFTIKGKGAQYNLMEVDDERIRIKEDNSPDQVGVMMGWKSKPGDTIVCLPHKVFVEIKSTAKESNDPDTDLIVPN